MSFLCSKPPPAPDYTAAAHEQGVANVDAARTGAWLNNPSQVTPYGSQTVTADPNQADHMVVTQTLSPEQQQLYDAGNQASMGGLNALNSYGLPAIVAAMQRGYKLPGSAQTDFNPAYKPEGGFQYDVGNAGPVQRGLNFGGAPGMPVADENTRQRVAQSIYNQGARFLDPRFAREAGQVDTKLANQGIFAGGAGYADAQRALSDEKTQAYGDLGDRAQQEAMSQMTQQFGMGMQARQQGVGEIGQQGQFANAAQGQAMQQLLDAMSGRNAAVGAQYGVAAQQAGLANSGRAQNFQEMTSGATLPVNIMAALMGTGQVQNPNFSPYSSNAMVAPAPIFQGAQAQGQAGINSFNAQQGALGNWLNAGSRIGSAFAMPSPSDRRLKSNVERIGTLVNGIPVYSYTIFGREAIGVMADEVREVLPEAVIRLANGYDAVDYSKLGV